MKKLMFVLLIALFLISTVSAQEDFTAYGPSIIKTFQCSMHESTVKVINSGTTVSTYYIEVEGTASDWAAFAPVSFTLDKGQSIDVKSYLEVPCTAKGDYTLDIYIVTSYGLEKAILQDINVEKPMNVDIRANVFSQSIDPCERATYNLTIINPADFTETYKFSVDQFKNSTYFDFDELTIAGGESKDLIVEIEPSSCDISGAYAIVFSAEAENTGVIAEIDLDLDISNTGIAEFTEGVKKIKTDYAEKGVELELFNKGDVLTEYSLSVEGTDWVTLDTETLSLEGKDSAKFTMLFAPAESVKGGKYPITVTAATAGVAYSKEIIVQLGEPTIIDTLFVENLAYTFIGIIIFVVLILLIFLFVRRYTSEEAKLARAKRRAEKEKRKKAFKAERERHKKVLQAEKDKQKRIKELEKKRKEQELEAASKKAVKKYDKEIKSEYKLIAKKDIIEGKKLPSRWLFNLILFIIILAVLGLAVQFRTFFWSYIWYVILGVVILFVLYILRWLGTKKQVTARWKGLVLANEALLVDINWREGLQQLSFALGAPAKKLRAVVKKGRTRHGRYHKPKDFVYQYFRAESSVDEVKQSKFRFKVSRKWLKRREIKDRDVALAVLKGDRYDKLKTVREGSDKKYIYYRASADCIGQFAIVGTTSAKERYRPYWIAWVAVIVLILVAIAVGAKLASESDIQAKGIPIQMWKQDEQHKLELDKYFNDPDGDKLMFTVTEAENIDIQIKNGVAYFTPDFEWSGQRIVSFTAEDGKNGKVTSNPVKLVVQKTVLPKAFVGYLKYILAGVIVLIVLIAFLVLRKPVMRWLDEE